MIRTRAPLILIALAVTLVLPPPQLGAQQAPNRVDVVAQVAAQFPAEWQDAHREDGPRGDAFIRRLAWTLHQIDARFGLNGKCATPAISRDVIAYRGRVEIGGIPIDVQAFDVITGAGGPNPRPAWSDISDPMGCGSLWIQPAPVDGPPPPPPDCTECQHALTLANGEIARLRDEVTIRDNRLGVLEQELAAARANQVPPDVAVKIAELTAAVRQERVVEFILFGQRVRAVIKEGR